MPEGFSLRARLESFRFALRGVRVLMRQHNSWIHAAATLAAVGLGLALRLPRGDWLWIVAAITWVWTAEGLNTALEQLADAVHPEPSAALARAKDVAAAGVLLAALGAAVVGCLVLGPPLVSALH